MKINYKQKIKNHDINIVFDFSEYTQHPITIEGVQHLNKVNIKNRFIQTMDVLFENAWCKFES